MKLPPEIEAKVLAAASSARSVNQASLNSEGKSNKGSNTRKREEGSVDSPSSNSEKQPPGQSGEQAKSSETPKKKSKYRNQKTRLGNLTFDSKLEAARWVELCLLQRAGAISFLTRPTKGIELAVNGVLICRYRPDFRYVENGKVVIEDSKGFLTTVYKLKRALMLAIHGITILETTSKRKRKPKERP